MKKIKLTRMVLENFKGIRKLDEKFGERTDVMGANATGKTTIMDAFTWCLFGKDSQNRTDSGRGSFQVKTVDADGNPIEKMDHGVELYFDIDGKPVVIKRCLKEEWVTKRGETEAKLSGNTTHYYWDGVEIREKDFSQRVAEVIIDSEKFKMLSNPGYFCSLPWENQLMMLNEIIGTVTFEDISNGNAEWEAECEKFGIGGYTERRKAISQSKLKCQKEIDSTTNNVTGIRSVMPDKPDTDELVKMKESITKEIDAMTEQMKGGDLAEQQFKADVQKMEIEINEMFDKLDAMKRKAEKKAEDEYDAANAEFKKMKDSAESLKRMIEVNTNSYSRQCVQDSRQIHTMDIDIEAQRKKIDSLRDEWIARNAEQYDGSKNDGELLCPLTNQPCDGASAKLHMHNACVKAMSAFNERKQADLAEMTKRGQMMKAELDKMIERKNEVEAGQKKFQGELDETIRELKGELADVEKKLEGISEVKMNPVTNTNDIPGYADLYDKLQKKINKKNEFIDGHKPGESTISSGDVVNKKLELEKINRELYKNETRKDCEAKIAECEARIKELAQQKADYEREEDLINEMNKARIAEMQRRCGGIFKVVSFKFVEKQMNGGEVDTCCAMVNGVKYADVNNAAKINAGLDIINAMCGQYDISAPIFIDNAESVNELLATDGQTIRLVVTEDKPMKIHINL